MYSTPVFLPTTTTSPIKCCGISLRFSCGVVCLIWAAFSMYLAVLSFQKSSLFYSYIPLAATTVFGVCNLIFSLVSAGGIFILIWDVSRYVKGLSHAICVCVFIVLVDSFVNIIIFITVKEDFNQWCIKTSLNTLPNLNTSAIEPNKDYFNCHNLWQDELKFGIIFYILMFALYVYWTLCLCSFALVREVSYISDGDIRHGGIVNSLPQNPMIDRAMPFNDPEHNVIILNNAKPSSIYNKKQAFTIEFRNQSHVINDQQKKSNYC